MKKRKLQKMFPPPSEVVPGVTWYSPSEWARVKATAIDPVRFENTFPEWESMANESFELVRERYPNAVKVFIVADEFFVWCHLRAQTNSADARAEFVAEKLRTTPPPVTANPSKKANT
jgi:hypothetical protein